MVGKKVRASWELKFWGAQSGLLGRLRLELD
jgi:hypothetical protein